MSHTAIVRTRIDDRTRAEAAAVLARIGMTVSDAVELMLGRVARDKALPSRCSSRTPRRSRRWRRRVAGGFNPSLQSRS